jgi:hypothetical protein
MLFLIQSFAKRKCCWCIIVCINIWNYLFPSNYNSVQSTCYQVLPEWGINLQSLFFSNFVQCFTDEHTRFIIPILTVFTAQMYNAFLIQSFAKRKCCWCIIVCINIWNYLFPSNYNSVQSTCVDTKLNTCSFRYQLFESGLSEDGRRIVQTELVIKLTLIT